MSVAVLHVDFRSVERPAIQTTMSLQAACDLVASSDEPLRGASVTFALPGTSGDALALLREVESFVAERGLRHRVEVQHRLATVHVWRAWAQ